MKQISMRNGVPHRLKGFTFRGRSVVECIHQCCDCGLWHDVRISHNGKCPNVDITFTRKKKEE